MPELNLFDISPTFRAALLSGNYRISDGISRAWQAAGKPNNPDLGPQYVIDAFGDGTLERKAGPHYFGQLRFSGEYAQLMREFYLDVDREEVRFIEAEYDPAFVEFNGATVFYVGSPAYVSLVSTPKAWETWVESYPALKRWVDGQKGSRCSIGGCAV